MAGIEQAGELIEGQLLVVVDGFRRVRLDQVGTVRHPLGEFRAAKEDFPPQACVRDGARLDAIIDRAPRYFSQHGCLIDIENIAVFGLGGGFDKRGLLWRTFLECRRFAFCHAVKRLIMVCSA